jgi:undecaprenyl-diphosphatase
MELVKKILVGVFLYAIIITISILFLEKVISLDTSALLAVNSLSNPYLDWFFILMTYAGSTVFWVLMIVLFWMKNRKVSLYLLIVFLLDTLSLIFLKALFFRPRPYDTLSVRLLNFDVELGSSFPSGHTERAFSGAVVLGSFYKRFRIPLLVLATLVGISRIYIGVHYPLDTLIGAINGILFGMLVLNLPLKKLKI